MNDVKTLRPDWRIARRISNEKGLIAARDWLSVPLVDLAASDFDPIPPEDLVHDNPTFEHWVHAPFNDAIYRVPMEIDREAAMHLVDMSPSAEVAWFDLIIRATKLNGTLDENTRKIFGSRLDVFERDEEKLTSLQYFIPEKGPVCCVDEACQIAQIPGGYIDGTHKARRDKKAIPLPGDLLLSAWLGVSGMTDHDWFQWVFQAPIGFEDQLRIISASSTWAKEFPTKQAFDMIVGVAIYAFDHALKFLYETDKHFVEVKRAPSSQSVTQKKKAQKTKARFPWLDEDLPSLIVIDPRNKRARSEPQGGTHASPPPGQRRGHWRTYRHPRFKNVRWQRRRVKPCYVGEREWIHRGSAYRVIDPEPENEK